MVVSFSGSSLLNLAVSFLLIYGTLLKLILENIFDYVDEEGLERYAGWVKISGVFIQGWEDLLSERTAAVP